MDEQSLLAALVDDPDDDATRAVFADWLEQRGDPERAADVRLEMAKPTVRAALDALLARLDVATTRESRVAAMLRAAAAGRRARMRGWSELVGQSAQLVGRADDPVAALLGTAVAANAADVRSAATAWLADHGGRDVPLRCIHRFGNAPRSPMIGTLHGPTAHPIMSIAIPRRGDLVVASTNYGALFAIELASGAVEPWAPAIYGHRIVVADPHRDVVYAATYVIDNPVVEQWDAATKTCTRTFTGHPGLLAHVATDGDVIVAAGAGDEISVWSIATGARTSLPEHAPTSLAVDRGRVYAGTRDGAIHVWSIAIGASGAAGQRERVIAAHEGPVTALAIARGATDAADDVEVISAADDIAIADGATIRRLAGHGGSTITSLAVIGDRLVSTGFDAVLRIWDRASGQRLQTIEGHSGRVHQAVGHPDGKRILSACSDATIAICDIEHALELPSAEIAWSRAEWLVGVDDRRILVGAEPGRPLACHDLDGQRGWTRPPDCREAIVRGELVVASGFAFSGGGPHVRSLADGVVARYFHCRDTPAAPPPPDEEELPTEVPMIAVGEDRILIGVSDDHVLYGWDIDTGAMVAEFPSQANDVSALLRCADGRVVSAGSDHILRVWELDGRLVHALGGHTQLVTKLFEIDGRLVSCANDATIRIWDLATGIAIATVELSCNYVAAIPGTTRLAVGQNVVGNERLSIVDVATRSIVTTVPAPGGFTAIAASARYIATTIDERDIVVWAFDGGSGDAELTPRGRWCGRSTGAIAWMSPTRLAVAESHGEVLILEVV